MLAVACNLRKTLTMLIFVKLQHEGDDVVRLLLRDHWKGIGEGRLDLLDKIDGRVCCHGRGEKVNLVACSPAKPLAGSPVSCADPRGDSVLAMPSPAEFP